MENKWFGMTNPHGADGLYDTLGVLNGTSAKVSLPYRAASYPENPLFDSDWAHRVVLDVLTYYIFCEVKGAPAPPHQLSRWCGHVAKSIGVEFHQVSDLFYPILQEYLRQQMNQKTDSVEARAS